MQQGWPYVPGCYILCYDVLHDIQCSLIGWSVGDDVLSCRSYIYISTIGVYAYTYYMMVPGSPCRTICASATPGNAGSCLAFGCGASASSVFQPVGCRMAYVWCPLRAIWISCTLQIQHPPFIMSVTLLIYAA